ncbi:NUDIX hydrolase [Actinoplanes xinjiangensis]|uniref:8-oxo-dGTP pyrophosphatase MutT (NUDIX family) n=1 Tax=Actinoplanes xinjiangensis TaxID=512350 RepID=A0A316FA02_9ACTN|nr:NUDIX domain-containing protein [Actinoplanes xinjiangensis]PWK42652.1 8-oxo-dGTP pyrophosphatase MutT (NUDIX family) [Actinoplanes xinjiangensis]
MTSVHRPAVRVICFDADGRILLMNWADPVSGGRLWEPPGGGIDPGETPLEAARRELAEETGLDPAAIGSRYLEVQRDTVWKGTRFVGPEQFFTASFPTARPPVVREGLLPYEQSELLTHAWVAPADLAGLPDRLEPPALPELLPEFRSWS